MLSRVAYSLYWLARYVERAENIARCIQVTLHLNLDRKLDPNSQWQPLIFTTGDQRLYQEKYGTLYDQERVLRFLSFDAGYANSILSSIKAARENARTVREVIANDMWEQLNELYQMVAAAAQSGDPAAAFYDQVIRGSITFDGISHATMSRNQAWQWLRLGVMLERADKTSRLLDVKYFLLLPDAAEVGGNIDQVQWTALLQSASAVQMFRQQHKRLSPTNVANFMLFEPTFPRSVAYCMARADESLRAITGSGPLQHSNEAEKCLGRALATLSFADSEDIINQGLHEFIDQQQSVINTIDTKLYEQYFAPPVN